ncbi:hypothetical protein OKA05_06260 [Luteolibacter arcticus]|uniref:HEAT repeat domain-containing protein n=1 Tax=Luteolibacter arcticus TaxID=1581411 RepID=A0ABT3GEY1_9BACT|nr:hypothetical protein [Luteolibacter arcticus]MCW1922147.1 hypothetical protein [Luteolibacter arcticus]
MRRIPIMPAALTLLATGLVGVWAWKATTRDEPRSAAGSTAPAKTGSSSPSADAISPVMDFLSGKPVAADARREFEELRRSLASMPKDEAVALIRSYLARGEDRTTGLSFEIAGDGSLKEWPTLRTFLIDALLALDPSAAAALSREILAKPTSADEWALALRNVARADPDTGFLRSKTEELIANPAWQANPSIGYLNAFDVLVHIGSTESTPLLSSLIQRKDRKDLAHAGFLTLDRLVQRQPVDELTRLAADTALQESRPEMVAQQFARADLRDSAQQSLVKAWLLDPARKPAELRSFAGVYPNNNHFVSNNLLTREATQSGDDLAAHDREALAVIAAWQQDPAFSPVKEHLAAMASRLNGFVGSRDGNSPPPE